MLTKFISLVSFLSLFLASNPAHSAVFNVSSGDVTGLIAAINEANSNGEENTINLAPGTYRPFSGLGDQFTMVRITGRMTISGNTATDTVIQGSGRRVFEVTSTGSLTINRLTVRGGSVGAGPGSWPPGAGIYNHGTVTVNTSVLEKNSAEGRGGGISNDGILNVYGTIFRDNISGLGGGAIFNSGTAAIMNSSLIVGRAHVGGGIFNSDGGSMTVQNSTISGNSAVSGGGIFNAATMVVDSSSVANNSAAPGPVPGFAPRTATDGPGHAAGITNQGTLRISNTTISGNFLTSTATFPNAGGIGQNTTLAVTELHNSILAINRSLGTEPPDCLALDGQPIISSGHNIIGDASGCDIALQVSDIAGDPGLNAFIDDGAPGHGRFALLPGSRAIDAGDDAACLQADQLDTPRRGSCDIGAVEFYPLVNDMVALANVKTDFDPTPVPNGPAGTFRITAEFTNTDTQTIGHRFAEVVELAGDNLLLNADRGAGGVGARLTLASTAGTPLLPGATETVEFIIGLQKQEPFTFFVNLLGDPEISNTSVTHLGK